MKTLTIFLAISVAAVYSSILEPEQKAKLREIRNLCAVEAQLGPYEIGTIIRAIRPVEKLVNATDCIVRTLVQQREENVVASEILARTKIVVETAVLPRVINHLIASCENLVGPRSCEKLINLVELILENIKRQKNSQDQV